MLTVRVAEIVEETDDIKSFRLAPRDPAGRLPRYEAGAHIDVTGPTGVTRQYSLCGSDPSSYLIAVKREDPSRGGSAALHRKVFVGDDLEISQPRNLFSIDRSAERHLLIAGGIGITPLLAMSYQLAREGARFALNYFARSPRHAAFTGVLSRTELAARATFHYGLSPSHQGAVLSSLFADSPAGTHAYICGPPAFLVQAISIGAAVLPAEAIHVEHFTAPAEAHTDDRAFEVELGTGEVFTIPADRTIADVLEQGGMWIETSCREGICGTCIAAVRAGVPDHRDNCLSVKEQAAGDRIALCVSRALTDRLVIEL